MENWFVVVMGICTVFVVLVLIIALCWLLGLVCRGFGKKETVETPKAAPALDDTSIPNRPQFVAAVSAAIAEASGTDASALRIVSIKKL